MGEEIIVYSETDLTIKSAIKSELIYANRVWHCPVDSAIGTRKWVTHGLHVTGAGMMDREEQKDFNIITS